MTIENARTPMHMYVANSGDNKIDTLQHMAALRHEMNRRVDRFKKRYALLLIAAAALVIYTILLSTFVHWRTDRAVRAEMEAEFVTRMDAYKAEQAYQEQAKAFLSDSDSRQVAINQSVDAVAAVISKLSTDAQKLTEASCMLARVMNPAYPDSFEEVAMQPQQWMFYDGQSNTYSEHDRELAESIIRPYMENGVIPTGLTADMVYAEWTPNDYVLRDSYKTTSTMHTWRYQ